MKRLILLVTLALLATGGRISAEEKAKAKPVPAKQLKSGLKPGDAPDAFNVFDVTGPNRGTTLCYRCAYGDLPTVTVFTREINEEVTELIKGIEGSVAKNKDERMSAFVIYLSDDPDAAEDQLTKLAKKHKIKNVPLTTYDGIIGPESYKINEDANLSVMMWVDSEVKVSTAFGKGKLGKKNVEKLLKSAKKILE